MDRSMRRSLIPTRVERYGDTNEDAGWFFSVPKGAVLRAAELGRII